MKAVNPESLDFNRSPLYSVIFFFLKKEDRDTFFSPKNKEKEEISFFLLPQVGVSNDGHRRDLCGGAP